mmetsp:Transcript_36006/g.101382  ORF Transcript_36006/g.101382 Transcript_36006/m.101382 type:complete len:275 (+) Transcript_36006:103-927(+)
MVVPSEYIDAPDAIATPSSLAVSPATGETTVAPRILPPRVCRTLMKPRVSPSQTARSTWRASRLATTSSSPYASRAASSARPTLATSGCVNVHLGQSSSGGLPATGRATALKAARPPWSAARCVNCSPPRQSPTAKMCRALVRNLLSTSMPPSALYWTPAFSRRSASRPLGLLPEAISSASASTRSPLEVHREIWPLAPAPTRWARPSAKATPSSRNASRMTALTSSSSRGSSVPTSVTLQPKRAKAWASSLPMGPPPTTMSLSGSAGMSKIVS